MVGPGGTAALTAAIAGGCEVAFGAFYDAWFDAALTLARSASRRDEAFGLDVVQDVMWKVVKRMPPLANEAAVEAWMARAIVRAVLDRLRQEMRRQRREVRAGAVRAAAHDADAPTALLAGESMQWLHAQLAELPAIDRELLTARFASDSSVTAAARALGLGADAAHGRLRRCLARLRRAAQEWFDG